MRVKSAASADDGAEQVTEHVSHAAREAAERQHPCTRMNGVPAGEQRQRGTDAEQSGSGEPDRPVKRAGLAARRSSGTSAPAANAHNELAAARSGEPSSL